MFEDILGKQDYDFPILLDSPPNGIQVSEKSVASSPILIIDNSKRNCHTVEFILLSDDKKNNLVQRGRCTSYSYPYLPEKAIIGGTAPPPYHSGKEL